jgi:S1-C subfamily serine protease
LGVLFLLLAACRGGAGEASPVVFTVTKDALPVVASARPDDTPAPKARAAAATPTALSPLEQTIGERMRTLTSTMVEVDVLSDGEVSSYGSGVIVSPRGEILTAAHVVEDPKREIRVILPDGSRREAQVKMRSDARDVALLALSGTPPPNFVRLRVEPLHAGEWVVCAGHGGRVDDQEPMRSAGVVVDPAYTWTVTLDDEHPWSRHSVYPPKTKVHPGMVLLDCAIARGTSGGPVVDARGSLVAVAVGGGVVSPVDGFRGLLPPSSLAPSETETPKNLALVQAWRPDGGPPSRAEALASLVQRPDLRRVTVELSVRVAAGMAARFKAVLVSEDGLAVAPAVWLTRPLDEVVVAELPDAKVAEIVAIQGEVALLRLSGLAKESHEPAPTSYPPAAVEVGQLLATSTAG